MFSLLESNPQRLLIYRLGSLGDTLVALPAFHLIRERFPRAEITLLTHAPVGNKAASLSGILEHSGLYQRVISYPLHLRSASRLNALRREIAAGRFHLAIHLAEFRGVLKSIRDCLFFRACGISRILGPPWQHRPASHEWEAQRLASRVAALGEINFHNQTSWDLRLTTQELQQADKLLLPIKNPFLAVSLGTKIDVNNWTENNWRLLLTQVHLRWPEMSLVFVGAQDEFDSCERCSRHWLAPKLNLCGSISPRVSAAVLQRARLFVGHDSGPLHLAATVGTPCVGIYSGRHLPGQWFPRGPRNLVIYHRTSCSGCGLNECAAFGKKCILSISVEEVLQAISRQFSRSDADDPHSPDERPFADAIITEI